MDYLIDDEFEETQEASLELTNQEFNKLKQFIKALVREAGGKLCMSDVVGVCHKEALGEESWKLTEGVILQAIQQNQEAWNNKRAEKESKKVGGKK